MNGLHTNVYDCRELPATLPWLPCQCGCRPCPPTPPCPPWPPCPPMPPCPPAPTPENNVAIIKSINTADQVLHSGSSIVFGKNTIAEGNAVTHTAGTAAFTIAQTGLYRIMGKFNYEAANTGTANFEIRNYPESAVVEQITQNPQVGTIMLNDVLYLAAGASIELYFPTVAGTTDVLTISQPVIMIEKIK